MLASLLVANVTDRHMIRSDRLLPARSHAKKLLTLTWAGCANSFSRFALDHSGAICSNDSTGFLSRLSSDQIARAPASSSASPGENLLLSKSLHLRKSQLPSSHAYKAGCLLNLFRFLSVYCFFHLIGRFRLCFQTSQC